MMSVDLHNERPERAVALIPGAYEPNTPDDRTRAPMRATSGPALPPGPSLMDAATIADREREGGGGPSQRRRRPPQAVTAAGDATVKAWWMAGRDLWFHMFGLARP